MAAEPTAGLWNQWTYLGVGLAVGVGIMIVALAKWGRKLLGDDKPMPIIQAPQCPYAQDHPMLNKFMVDSETDRHEMWNFLGGMNSSLNKMEGKLDVLLQGARVRWNQGLIPTDKDGGK